MGRFYFIFFCWLSLTVYAQNDSIPFTKNFRLNEGIYLSYSAFRENNPIPKHAIKSKENRDQLEFITKTLEDQEEITFVYNGKDSTLKTDSLWGYCQNNTLYLKYYSNFCRIPVFANLSRFIAVIDVLRTAPNAVNYVNNPMGIPMPPTQVKAHETRQFIFDFYTGEIIDYDLENFKELLTRDQALYKEFSSLRKHQQKKMFQVYLKRYNDMHTIFFPNRNKSR